MMTDPLSEFRKQADEVLQEMTVTERLRSQTIRRMHNRHALPGFSSVIRRLLPLGVTALLFFTIGYLAPIDKVSEPIPENEGTEFGSPEGSNGDGLGSLSPLVDLPAYWPKAYQLQQIVVSPREQRSELVYAADDAAFTLSREPGPQPVDIADFRKVYVQDTPAWIRQAAPSELELRWNKQNKHYRLTGAISEEEAIKVAESL